jgi:hypothetical protein
VNKVLTGVAALVLFAAGCSGGGSGDRIAFTSDRNGDYEIFVMNADGTNVHQLTNNENFREPPKAQVFSSPLPATPPPSRKTLPKGARLG